MLPNPYLRFFHSAYRYHFTETWRNPEKPHDFQGFEGKKNIPERDKMENKHVVKQLYHNVNIYSHDFKAEFFECKTTFSIIFILFCRQSESY